MGMPYYELASSDTNTVEIPDSNGTTLTITTNNGRVAWMYTRSDGVTLTCYLENLASSTKLTDDLIIDGTTVTFLDLNYNDWTIQ